MELLTERLILRDYLLSDVENILKYSNNLNISQFMSRMPYPNTTKLIVEHINKSLEESTKSKRANYKLGIAQKENNKIIGGIALSDIDYYNGTATIGYWLGEEFWKQGIMSEAAKKVVEFAFNELNLRRLNAGTHSKNTASKKLLKKLGFVHEGTRAKYVRIISTGELRDTYNYGLLKENWIKTQKN